MSDISIHGILGALCVLLAIAAGVLGLFVSLVIAGVRSSSGVVAFGAAFRRVFAGPAVCTAVGLLGLAWVAQASSNETVDEVGPFFLLVAVAAGIATGVVASRRLRAPG